ncbi:methionyl aminopeptidase [Clostridium sp. MD294]|uniref:methionyl aminopeptidase n=1 Tax=Clostridium sp. MD294 TaxID=97138 RepID=UPI0002C9C50E|nr:methionyl aminopeptidase [Clostridium sp. MD294]NDO47710.1 methionyl aminopeptidase [Clostridium sp. MD294]USF29972.1 Methionine aminopeptidase [Clostridium sp. MD294]
MKLGRNDPCWCGSHKKYKSCHLAFDEKLEAMKKEGILVPPHKIIKTAEQIEGIRESGKLNTKVLDLVEQHIKEGMTTEEINTLVHEYTVKNGGIPAPLNYKGFPKSVCTSVNNEVCHGIPDKNRILKNGDIVNVDVTTILNGYYADASRMFCIGEVSEEAKRLVEVTKQCLDAGLEAVKAWGYLGDVGYAVNNIAKKNGYAVVEEIGGHGVGLGFHEEPYVCHVGRKNTGMVLVPGMVFTIEPMINAGKREVYQDADNGWTIYTQDGTLSAQWEYTVAITEDGVEILTK